MTIAGTPFYIGKGTGRRAWDADRHPVWHWYVKRHLDNQYQVVILNDNLSSDNAERLESNWIAQETRTLVNWVNIGRETDFEALDLYWSLRRRVDNLVADARSNERTNDERAVQILLEAFALVDQFANIDSERGLVGQILREMKEEGGLSGHVIVIDRLTLCLKRLKRLDEAKSHTEEYFQKFRADRTLVIAKKVLARVGLE